MDKKIMTPEEMESQVKRQTVVFYENIGKHLDARSKQAQWLFAHNKHPLECVVIYNIQNLMCLLKDLNDLYTNEESKLREYGTGEDAGV